MPSPYNLPYGCIFREDFINPYLASQNGLVITGTPWLGNGVQGVLSKTGTLISVPRLTSRISPITIIADIDLTAFTGTDRTIIHHYRSNGALYWAALSGTSNRLFWNADVRTESNEYTPGRSIIAYSCTGVTTSFYQNGNSLGSGAGVIKSYTGANYFSIGSTLTLNDKLLLTPMYSLSIYNYAMSASEILQNYQLTRGLSV